MKLELPNGFSLFLWENEVEKINLHDSQIEIIRPSGKVLKITLSDFWKTNLPARHQTGPLTHVQLRPPQTDLTPSLKSSPNMPDQKLVTNSLRPCFSLQSIIEDFKNSLMKSDIANQETQISIDAIKRDLEFKCLNLEEKIKQVDLESSTGISEIDKKLEETRNHLNFIMNELGDVCKEILRRQEDPILQDEPKKTSGERLSKIT